LDENFQEEPAETLLEVSPEGAVACMRAIRRMAPAVIKSVGADGLSVSQLNGPVGVDLWLHAAIRADIEKLKAMAPTFP